MTRNETFGQWAAVVKIHHHELRDNWISTEATPSVYRSVYTDGRLYRNDHISDPELAFLENVLIKGLQINSRLDELLEMVTQDLADYKKISLTSLKINKKQSGNVEMTVGQQSGIIKNLDWMPEVQFLSIYKGTRGGYALYVASKYAYLLETVHCEMNSNQQFDDDIFEVLR